MDVHSYKCLKQQGYDDPFEAWLDKIFILGVISHEDWHRESGKFFGYPDCCIKWFIFMGKMNISGIAGMMDYLYGYTGCGYVKCPKCVRKELKEHGTTCS